MMTTPLLKLGYVWQQYPEITTCGLRREIDPDVRLCAKPGVVLEMWETFAAHLGFRYQMMRMPGWNQLVWAVGNGTIDGTAAFLFLQPERYVSEIIFTHPLVQHEGGFLGRSTASLEPHMKLYVFGQEALVIIFVTLVLLLLVCIFAAGGSCYVGTEQWFRLLSYQGEIHLRYVTNPFLLVGLLYLLLMYNGGIKSQRLSLRHYDPPFRDFPDARERILSGDVRVFVFDPFTATTALREYLYKDEEAWGDRPPTRIIDPNEMRRILCTDRRNVMFGNLGVLGEIWTAFKGHCQTQRFGGVPELTDRLQRYEGIMLRSKLKYAKEINRIVEYLYSTGQMENFLISKYNVNMNFKGKSKADQMPVKAPISLDGFQPAFLLLLGGFTFATLVCFGERIRYEAETKRRSRKTFQNPWERWKDLDA